MAFRNDDTDALANANGTGRDGYTDGTPGADAPTPHRAKDLNMIQEELCRTVELHSDLTTSRDGTDQVQLKRAILTEIVGAALGAAQSVTTATSTAWYGGCVAPGDATHDKSTVVIVGGSGGAAINRRAENVAELGSAKSLVAVSVLPTGTDALRDVCWSPALQAFCAVGEAGLIATCATKTAQNWTNQTAAGSTQFNSVVWADSLSLYVAVGESAVIETSPDGVTWTARTAAGSSAFNEVTWSEELTLLVAAGDGGTIETSPDGITWTARTAAASYTGDFHSATWNADLSLFCLGAGTGAADTPLCQTSPDGITWTQRTIRATLDSYGGQTRICTFRGLFVGVCISAVFVSPDGVNWAANELPNTGFAVEKIFAGANTVITMDTNTDVLATNPVLAAY